VTSSTPAIRTGVRCTNVLEVDWEPADEACSSLRFELTPQSGGTRFNLTHRALTPVAATQYGAGWHTYLEQLAASLTTGSGRGPQWDTRYEELLQAYQTRRP